MNLNRLVIAFVIISQVCLWVQTTKMVDNYMRMNQAISTLARAVTYLRGER